jgi:hypothetical protein
MTQADFIACLESQLGLHGVAYDGAELLEWVASMWPHLADDPDVQRWAGEFAEGRTLVWQRRRGAEPVGTFGCRERLNWTGNGEGHASQRMARPNTPSL